MSITHHPVAVEQQQRATQERPAMEERASSLVNPASGLANDYLNLFNEIVMIIEQLPAMPELFEDLLAWKPTTYQEYFARSDLPGRHSALADYQQLNPRFRRRFEAVVQDLDRLAVGTVVSIRRHIKTKGESDLQTLVAICEKGSAGLREKLEEATLIVNHGTFESAEDAQARADRLLAVRINALKNMSEFWARPRFPAGEDEA
ncbi:hypothetical protein PY365_09650 [Roseiarcaceae bacterium H3SJ34-1]|uniref:hypothetical protein n=1 Tax=Terripilifer ovatus TaxID=3032367 RepID=UPI003AB92136|nr:hypothetical protein [Roseiarcaceae bacterium H3SJ34-1]